MNPYLHELRHALGGGALVATIIFALLGAGLSYGVVVADAGPTVLHGAGFYTYENGSFHIVLYLFGPTGQPVGGASVHLSFLRSQNFTANGSFEPPRIVATLDATSAPDGRLAVEAPLTAQSYGVDLSVGGVAEPTGQLELDGALMGFGVSNATPGAVVALDPITEVATSEYTTSGTLVFVTAGPYGAPPSGDRVVQCENVTSQRYGAPSNCTNLTTRTLASLSGYRTTVAPLPAPPNSEVVVELLNTSGGVVNSYSFGPNGEFFGSNSGSPTELTISPPGASALGGLTVFLPLVLFFDGFLLAYLRYARPRLNTTLEPLLVRPVTRLGLLLTRYLALTVLLAGAAVVSVVATDATATALIGVPMPLSFAVALVGALLGAALSIVGVVFATAHLFRSGGAVLSLGFALVAVFGLFWFPLTSLSIRLLAPDAGFYSQQTLVLQLGLASPPLLPSYVVGFLTGTANTNAVGPSYGLAGVTVGLVALIAVLWVALPLLAAVARARWSD